ncbi:hypothetical protein SAMN05518672_113123 [Chitinophaga sp. CF118]|uniref:hypothetical protein n=1 Tax=Chitinophaga sp. CF118 TaxID=1884367 RepID=UPI0008E20B93|nr:hypothetical protein [Chitinophaga sp. CF118]SFE97832.1 hypothetical protein SAMN05518672_113123 [Chitinophaga sp. CF118]
MKKIVLGSFSLLVLTFILFISQTGCKKETFTNITKVDTVYKCTPTIQGLWTGMQLNSASAGQTWSCSIRADGTASYENTIFGIRQLSTGTWTLTNETWTCNMTCVYGVEKFIGAAQTFTATYNATTGTLTNGTYVTTTPGLEDSGTFTLTEVN